MDYVHECSSKHASCIYKSTTGGVEGKDYVTFPINGKYASTLYTVKTIYNNDEKKKVLGYCRG